MTLEEKLKCLLLRLLREKGRVQGGAVGIYYWRGHL